MMPDKKFLQISALAITIVFMIGFFSFYFGERTEQFLTGKVTSSVYIQQAPPANCSVELHEGLNFVSFFCESGILPINQTLVNESNQTLNYSVIYSYFANNPENSWGINKPDLPDYVVNDLTHLDRLSGYWIIMNSPGNYSKEGSRFPNNIISLKPGWNLIGYPTSNTINITFGLQGIYGKYSHAESYQRENETEPYNWLIYNPNYKNNTLHFLESMKAYFINVTNETSINVNW